MQDMQGGTPKIAKLVHKSNNSVFVGDVSI